MKAEASSHSPSVPVGAFVAAGFISLAATTFAQDPIVPQGSDTSAPLTSGSAQIETLQADAIRSNTTASGPTVDINGRTLAETPRRFKYSLSLTVRGVYDDNINISSFDRVVDYYVAIEPSLSLGFGGTESEGRNTINLIYRPSAFLFVNHSENDAIQHLVRLQGQHQFGRLSLSLLQDVQILDGPDLNSISDPTGHTANIDVGRRTRHQVYTTTVGGAYDLTGKLFLSGAAHIAIDDYQSQIGSKVFAGDLFINFNYSPKLVIGLGGTGGYNTVGDSSPDQTFEQANVRVRYEATAKVTLSASGGAEFRQFENNSRGTYVSPVYALSATYQPFDGTSINLSGNRSTQNSASLSDEDYTSTSINIAVRQRLLQRIFLGLAGGYEKLSYFSTVQSATASRNDDYYFIEPSIDLTIMRFWTAGAYYLHRHNFSSFDLFSFYDNQVGIRSTITF